MGNKWTDKEDIFLASLRRADTPYAEIATIMGGRTAAACQQRVFQLGLTNKHKPKELPPHMRVAPDWAASYPLDHEHNFLKPKPKPSWWEAKFPFVGIVMMWWRT
tara:strand:+ start:262 stop:576 length:315 start_codon:yes stop_codon:yes gene_type:complete